MAIASLSRSKHRPYTSGGIIRGVVGNTVVKTGFAKDRPIRSVAIEVVGSSAPTVLAKSWADNADGTVTVYLWKATAAGDTTQIAATVATDIAVRIEVD